MTTLTTPQQRDLNACPFCPHCHAGNTCPMLRQAFARASSPAARQLRRRAMIEEVYRARP